MLIPEKINQTLWLFGFVINIKKVKSLWIMDGEIWNYGQI